MSQRLRQKRISILMPQRRQANLVALYEGMTSFGTVKDDFIVSNISGVLKEMYAFFAALKKMSGNLKCYKVWLSVL